MVADASRTAASASGPSTIVRPPLDERVALVTGGSSGITGANVALDGGGERDTAAAAGEIGAYPFVADDDCVRRLVDEVQPTLGAPTSPSTPPASGSTRPSATSTRTP